MPWASSAATSFLATPGEMRTALRDAGFAIVSETDRTDFALRLFELLRAQAAAARHAPADGRGLPGKVANMVRNVASGRCGPREFVCRKV